MYLKIKQLFVFSLLFCFFVIFIFPLNIFAVVNENNFLSNKKINHSQGIKESRWIFGKSWHARPLWAYSFGQGENVTIYLAGVHSGIERGAVGLANFWISFLRKNKKIIPKNHKVIIIPNLNPDGWVVYSRVNAHNIDLNRNFSVDWQKWANFWSAKIYGGPKPFSEPESIAFKNLAEKELNSKKIKNRKLIDFHVGTNQIFAPYIEGKLDQKSLNFAKFYNKFAGYPQDYSFDYYKITGSICAWVVKTLKANAITVELGANNSVSEFKKNKEAMIRVIKY